MKLDVETAGVDRIVTVPDSLLRERAIKVKEETFSSSSDDKLIEYYDRMVALAESSDLELAGLAANQCSLALEDTDWGMGLNIRLMIIREEDRWTSMVNPVITKRSYRTEWELEGCASIPNTVVNVKRNWEINMTYFNLDAILFTRTLDGALSRVIQHEVDHLDGKLITDYADKVEFLTPQR